MAVPRRGWRSVIVDQRRYFWRAIGGDCGIEVIVITEMAFTVGATAQQLTFRLGYDHLQISRSDGSKLWRQHAAVAPGVVRLAIQYATASTPSFTGNIGEQNIALPDHFLPELQAAARTNVKPPS
ncbi:MAG: hypothetical protein IPK82_44350 [Polyangiaceae bacterium]|nr:hypothetical protein [Polyangiaceae bacterium]